jgi:glutamate racemase
MRLGVFDSGIGGEAVASALQQTFPKAEIITVNDRRNIPYGDKSADDIARLTDTAIQPLFEARCEIIIIACNTATAIALEPLRTKYPQQRFIGIEPMIKPASSLTKTGVIAVCATPATLASKRYKNLIQKYATHLEIIEPDCSQWAYWIENNQINRDHIATTIDNACRQGADVIVLGCTHYHWIKEYISDLAAGRAQVIEPSEAIGRRVSQLLQLS